jgi:hypothetical protein
VKVVDSRVSADNELRSKVSGEVTDLAARFLIPDSVTHAVGWNQANTLINYAK